MAATKVLIARAYFVRYTHEGWVDVPADAPEDQDENWVCEHFRDLGVFVELDPHEPAVTFQQGGLAARQRRWAEHLQRALTRVDVWILISTIALVVLACLTLAWS